MGFIQGTWDFASDAGSAAWQNRGDIGRAVGLIAIAAGAIWLGSKVVGCGARVYGATRDAVVEVGRTIDDTMFTGRNPQGLYSLDKPIRERYKCGKLRVDFKDGEANITFRTSKGGLYEILENDGDWSEAERMVYTAPGRKPVTLKENVGGSHAEALDIANDVYRHSISRLERKVELK